MRLMLLGLMLVGLAGCRESAPNEQAGPPAPAASSTSDPWRAARERGVEFRAVGQEPGWFLDIDATRMHLAYDYASRQATTPVPAPTRSGTQTTYAAVTEAHRLTVVIDERRCEDSMSGEPFSTSVTVTIDGRTLEGCGRWLRTSEPLVASAGALGPMRVGMTPEEAAAALGSVLVHPDASSECSYARVPDGPDGVSFMVVGGRIVRADITAPGVPTAEGIEVGSREALVRQVYGNRAVSSPHKYTNGRYLTIAPDETHRVVFETDGTQVTRYRIGQRPQVEWVEGCG